jgi:uncharacterized protein YjbJ (UPF0337 family)
VITATTRRAVVDGIETTARSPMRTDHMALAGTKRQIRDLTISAGQRRTMSETPILTSKGAAKEQAGKATGNKKMEREGKMDQTKSNLKQAGEKAKDAFEK